MVLLENKWLQLDFDEDTGFFDIINKVSGLRIANHIFSSVYLCTKENKDIILSSFNSKETFCKIENISDVLGDGKSLIVAQKFENDFVLTLFFNIYEEAPFIYFQTAIKSNHSGYKLNSFHPFHLSKAKKGGLKMGSIANWRLFRTDWQSWSPIEITPLNKPQKRPWMKLPKIVLYSTMEKFAPGAYLSDYFVVIKNLETQQFLLAGFTSMKNHLTHIVIHVNHKKDEFLELFAKSLVGRILLPENQEIYSEKFVLIVNGMQALDSLDYYTNLVQKEMSALSWDSVPTGWCSWYYYYTLVSQEAILENSKFLLNNQKETPLAIVQLDDGYLAQKRGKTRIGDWCDLNKRFNKGLVYLASEIKADGFIPGLWIAPFLITNSSKLFADHPDWVIRDHKGKPFEVNINVEWGLFNKIYGLDCTHPEVQKWIRTLFKTIVEKWGFQYIKLDFLYAAAIDGVFYDKSMTRIQAYRKGLEIIRETVGKNIFLLGCGAPLGPSIGLVNGMRVSGDTYYSFGQPFLFWFLNTFFFAGFEGMPSMKSSLKTNMLRAFMHNKFWINDPDCLLVRKTRSTLKQHEIEFEVTLLGLCGGILFSSDKLSELLPLDLEYIKFLLPPSKFPAKPIDLFENDPPMYFKLEISPPLSMEPYYLMGIFNWSKKAKQIIISSEQFRLDSTRSYHIFDFWAKSYYQIPPNDSKEVLLRGNSAKLLAIHPLNEMPQLISTTFHITQGGTEISNFEFNPESNDISIEIAKSGRNQGQLYIYLPPNYHEKELISDGTQSSMFHQQDGLLGIEIAFEDRTQITIKLEGL